jgi:hypothetical protein
VSTNLETLQTLSNNPAAVAWFKGLFKHGHIQMTDTGEQITVVHHGDRLEAIAGHVGENPNFIIPLESENIKNLVGFFTDHQITEHEQYRIVKFMLQPCLKAALSMPILQNGAFRKAARLDTHWQEALLDPSGKEDEQITVVCVNDQWLVIPGYHGKPQRRLVMKPQQILDYQRRVFEANEKGGLTAWLDVAKWYLSWRDSVSVPV